VRDLPHHLIASFRATLEEATHADLLLVVLDVSDPNAELHFDTVMSTLDELVAESRDASAKLKASYIDPKRLVLLNKADKLRDNSELLYWQSRVRGEHGAGGAIAISARDLEHQGHAELAHRVNQMTKGEIRERVFSLPISDAKSLDLIERRSEVLDREYTTERVTYTTRIGERQLRMLQSMGAAIVFADTPAPSSTSGM
ncbi:MAG: hypothetical protein AAGB34_00280, partial [Planctomycetota bacterium]